MDVGRPLPWNTHGPHHHEKIAPLRRVGPGRLRCRDGPVVRWLLFRPLLPALWLLRLRRQVLRSPVQRLQPGVLRHGLLRWLLPVRPRLRLRREWLRTWRVRWRHVRRRHVRRRHVRRRHVPVRRLRHAVQRRSRLSARRLRRRCLPRLAAGQRTGSRRAGRPRRSRRRLEPGRYTRAAAGRPDFPGHQRSRNPEYQLSSPYLHRPQHHRPDAGAAANDGRSLLLGQLIALSFDNSPMPDAPARGGCHRGLCFFPEQRLGSIRIGKANKVDIIIGVVSSHGPAPH
jgi:hypothetical protein